MFKSAQSQGPGPYVLILCMQERQRNIPLPLCVSYRQRGAHRIRDAIDEREWRETVFTGVGFLQEQQSWDSFDT